MAGADDRIALTGDGEFQPVRVRAIEDGTGDIIFSKDGGNAKDEAENSAIGRIHLCRPGNQPQGKNHETDFKPIDFAPLRRCGRVGLNGDLDNPTRDLDDAIGLICDVRAVEWHHRLPVTTKRPLAAPRSPAGRSSYGGRSSRTRFCSPSIRYGIVYIRKRITNSTRVEREGPSAWDVLNCRRLMPRARTDMNETWSAS
jgi:hypothetical protein